MNFSISGWSVLRITILAARRVLPPDLITPAKASKPFMNESGPEALPPLDRLPFSSRSAERLVPVPEPHLNSIPSVLARSRIDSSESCTETMKHAEHCGRLVAFSSLCTCWVVSSKYQPYPRASATPTLNQTGELKQAFWVSIRCASSARKFSPSASVLK